MIVSIIAAIGKNKVIGNKNSLPWNLPADMDHFRKLTKGKPVIMGRKTFESIGKPLPGRTNITLTHDKNYKQENCIIVHSVEDALKAAKGNNEVMIIGGANVYKEFIQRSDRMYLTLIDHDFEGDAYFPDYKEKEWVEVNREQHKSDEKNKYDYIFLTLKRITN